LKENGGNGRVYRRGKVRKERGREKEGRKEPTLPMKKSFLHP